MFAKDFSKFRDSLKHSELPLIRYYWTIYVIFLYTEVYIFLTLPYIIMEIKEIYFSLSKYIWQTRVLLQPFKWLNLSDCDKKKMCEKWLL